MVHFAGLMSILTISLTCVALTFASSPKYPVVLVPGFAGSELWRMPEGCNTFRGLWINPYKFIKFVCGSNELTDRLTLLFDNSTGKTRENSNEKNQACGFGDPHFLESIVTSWRQYPWDTQLSQEQCDGAHKRTHGDSEFDFETFRRIVESELRLKLAKDKDYCPHLQIKDIEASWKFWDDLHYFKKLIKTLTNTHGYVRNTDIRGAPYDFRKAPRELGDYFEDLKKLIEDTSAKNGNLPVVVIAHSMGNLVTKHFYNHYTETGWTQKYIKAHVAIAPPWAGAVKIVGVLTSGDNFEIPKLRPTRFRAAARSFMSSMLLMPCVSSNGFWNHYPPIVVTPSKNYSISTEGYRQLFKDLKFETGYSMWQWVGKDSLDVSKLPNIPELHVLYGTDVDTFQQFVYNRQEHFPDVYPSVIKGDGDGTVNIISLEAMKVANNPGNKPVYHTPYKGVDHMAICRDPRVIDYIVKLVTTGKQSANTDL